MKGRKRLPIQVKAAKGTLRPHREKNSPDYVLMKQIPPPPSWLSEEGRKVYYDTAEELLKAGILNRIVYPLFIAYVAEIASYLEAKRMLSEMQSVYKDGTGSPKINPFHRIANESFANAIRIGTEFGLTPASVGKVTAMQPPEMDEKAKLLKKLMQK